MSYFLIYKYNNFLIDYRCIRPKENIWSPRDIYLSLNETRISSLKIGLHFPIGKIFNNSQCSWTRPSWSIPLKALILSTRYKNSETLQYCLEQVIDSSTPNNAVNYGADNLKKLPCITKVCFREPKPKLRSFVEIAGFLLFNR